MKPSTIATAMAYSLAVALVGCSNIPNNMPLVFGEDISLGISMGGSATSQGAELTLGFKSKDVAIIPVVTSASGVPTLIQGSVTNGPDGSEKTIKDSYSVLGQFGSTTDENGKKIGLGKFFATGQAATYLANGFAKAMSSSAVPAASSVPSNQ